MPSILKRSFQALQLQVSGPVKRLINHLGYDIRRHRPHLDTLLQARGIRTVIDVGANTGEFAKDIHRRIPNAAIYSFEPLRSCYEELISNMAGVERFTAWQIGLGDVESDATIHKSAFAPSSSLLSMAELHKKLYPESASHTEEQVKIKTLDSMLPAMDIRGPLLVKIDVQGYEDKVVRGAQQTLRIASLVVIETSFRELYVGQPLFADIHGLLVSLGFYYYGSGGQGWDSKTNELIYEDSIFVRRPAA